MVQLLLGADPERHRAHSLTLMASLMYLINITLIWLAVRTGHADPVMSQILIATMLTGAFLFYGLLRSGFTQRFRDPALVIPQVLFCLVTIALAYLTVSTRLRGMVLTCLPVVFLPGQFRLSNAQLRLVSGASIVIMGGAMVLDWALHPWAMDFLADLLQWFSVSTVVVASSYVAQHVGRMQRHLEDERQTLSTVLDEVQVMAAHDQLTGLINRRRMDELLRVEWPHHRQDRPATTLIMLDLDHFKRVNDSYGHQAGDEVLRRFAETATASLRQMDVIARWGGEEFLVMCPGTPVDQALVAVRRVLEAVRSQSLLSSHPDLVITCSAGVASAQPGESIEHTIERADRALYRAKTNGRNRIEVEEPNAQNP